MILLCINVCCVLLQMFQGGPSNNAETGEQVADKRAYEDSRPSLSSYVYPDPIKMWVPEHSKFLTNSCNIASTYNQNIEYSKEGSKFLCNNGSDCKQ